MTISAGIKPNPGSARSERGSVVLLLLVLLGIMAVYLASNNLALNQLHRDLRLIEQKQIEKFSHPPAPVSPKP